MTRTIRSHGRFLVRHPLNVAKTAATKFVGGPGKNQHNIVYAHTGGGSTFASSREFWLRLGRAALCPAKLRFENPVGKAGK